MTETPSWRTKISDADLARFLETDAEGARSVLLVVDLPIVTIKPASDNPNEGWSLSSGPILFQGDDDEEANDRQIGDAADAVEEICGYRPNILRSAGTLVAELTPTQLAAIADLELISEILPNRRFKSG